MTSHTPATHYAIVHEKTAQAVAALRELDLGAWLLMGRETLEMADPSLALVVGTTVTWISAFIIPAQGEKVAIVGTYDVPNLQGTGNFDRVLDYVGSPRDALLDTLRQLDPQSIAINISTSDKMADGLTTGLYLKLQEYLAGTPYAERLVPSDRLVSAVRARKSLTEVARVRAAIDTTLALFERVGQRLQPGQTEAEIHGMVSAWVADLGLSMAWDAEYCPTVHNGARPIGHTTAGEYRVTPGTIVHMDLGVKQDGYCSDLQRVWYVSRGAGDTPPAELTRAFETVVAAIQAGARALKPGVAGWEVDAVARKVITDAGYPEYLHAFGHQVGRAVHDGMGLLGPRWERYGETPFMPVEVGNIFTLELGVEVPGIGYVGLEEDALVTDSGIEWLAPPQTELFVI
ncbi:MAG: aminopeptidase P family protein [Anaerolineae bacterium]|nr:aminopeptidase P family protein [Anaerolineae bacterium]